MYSVGFHQSLSAAGQPAQSSSRLEYPPERGFPVPAEDDNDLVPIEFTFNVPPKCQPGSKMQVTAPDGIALLVPVPMNAHENDKIVMQRTDNGTWVIGGLKRAESPPASPPDSPPAQSSRTASMPLQPAHPLDMHWRSQEQLQAELTEQGGITIKLQTTKGPISLRIVPKWAPKGARRFLQLVDHGFFDSRIAVYRAVPDFLVQFGVVKGGLPVNTIEDDDLCGVPVEAGSVVFAAAGANSRRHTLCIFLEGFPTLGRKTSETPIGKVYGYSMETLRSLYTGYGDIPQAGGTGPDPIELEEQGNHYINSKFPSCDFITGATRVQDEEETCVVS